MVRRSGDGIKRQKSLFFFCSSDFCWAALFFGFAQIHLCSSSKGRLERLGNNCWPFCPFYFSFKGAFFVPSWTYNEEGVRKSGKFYPWKEFIEVGEIHTKVTSYFLRA